MAKNKKRLVLTRRCQVKIITGPYSTITPVPYKVLEVYGHPAKYLDVQINGESVRVNQSDVKVVENPPGWMPSMKPQFVPLPTETPLLDKAERFRAEQEAKREARKAGAKVVMSAGKAGKIDKMRKSGKKPTSPKK